MTLYLQNQQTSVTWPEPFESTWQLLGGTYNHDLAPKLPHLGLSDILFNTCLTIRAKIVPLPTNIITLNRLSNILFKTPLTIRAKIVPPQKSLSH